MARTRLIKVVVIAGSLVVGVPAANAALAVLDGTMVGKAIEQIKELKAQMAVELEQLAQLKESLMFLNEISRFAKDLSAAIGEITHITLPITNIIKMAAQARSDIACLMPDGASWGVSFRDLNTSICDNSLKYRQALFLSSDRLKGMSYVERDAERRQIVNRRDALFVDATTRALAQADVQMKNAETATEAADQLQSDLNAAKTVQDRLHVVGEIGIAQLRGDAARNQMLAQMLRVLAAEAIQGFGRVDGTESFESEDGK